MEEGEEAFHGRPGTVRTAAIRDGAHHVGILLHLRLIECVHGIAVDRRGRTTDRQADIDAAEPHKSALLVVEGESRQRHLASASRRALCPSRCCVGAGAESAQQLLPQPEASSRRLFLARRELDS